jgi:hypothetical protein
MAVKSTKAVGSCVAPREEGRQAGAMRCDMRRAASSTSAPLPCMRLYNWRRRRRSVPKSPRTLLTSLLCPVRKRVGPAVPCPPDVAASKRSRPSSPRRQSARSLHLPLRARAVTRAPGRADAEQRQYRRPAQGQHAADTRQPHLDSGNNLKSPYQAQ